VQPQPRLLEERLDEQHRRPGRDEGGRVVV
jgi:hypothetical protein